MSRIAKLARWCRFLADDAGTSTVEYLVLAGLLVAIGIVALSALLNTAAGAGAKAEAGIESIPQASLGGGG